MDGSMFDEPIFVKTGTFLVQEIACITDAIDFLERWPVRHRDLIHETALTACYEAHDGHKPASVARNAVEGFARRAGILEDAASVMPLMTSTPA